MAEMIKLKAELRKKIGKGASRKYRREGKVPAIIYGDNQGSIAILLSYNLIYKLIYKGGFKQTLFLVNINNSITRVICRAVQLDPVRDIPIHIDFFRLAKDAVFNIEIPVTFLNKEICPGLKNGGVLNVICHYIKVIINNNEIPSEIKIDLSELNINESIHISEISFPTGIKAVNLDYNFTIVSITSFGNTQEIKEDNADNSKEVLTKN